jgi:hypothetical protein
MFKKFSVLLALVALMALSPAAWAQDDDTTDDDGGTTTSQPTSTVDFFAVLCEDRIVIDLAGTMQSGYDIYYQVFSASGGGGNALTDLRRVQVSGSYSVSDSLNYSNGTLPVNTVGSLYLAIAREGNANSTIYSDFTDELQDGCREPGNTVVNSDSTGQSTTTTTTTSTSTTSSTTRSRSIVDGQFTDTRTSAILSPFGGYLNPDYVPADDSLVTIGANDNRSLPRQATPGLIFAECESYKVAEPGIVYDNDNVVVFWSWFTATEEQMIDHISDAQYSVTYYQTLVLPNVVRSEIQVIGGRYWVFYYSILGNLRPGRYYIEYKVSWDDVHFDGFTEYGPGTENPILVSGCDFVVQPNPDGVQPSYNPWPYQ